MRFRNPTYELKRPIPLALAGVAAIARSRPRALGLKRNCASSRRRRSRVPTSKIAETRQPRALATSEKLGCRDFDVHSPFGGGVATRVLRCPASVCGRSGRTSRKAPGMVGRKRGCHRVGRPNSPNRRSRGSTGRDRPSM